MLLARRLSLTDGSFACCRHQSCEVTRSCKHEEAAKKQCVAGRGKARALQDLISVKFSPLVFCHNVKGDVTLFTVHFSFDRASLNIYFVVYTVFF